jgi:hypothetical protein
MFLWLLSMPCLFRKGNVTTPILGKVLVMKISSTVTLRSPDPESPMAFQLDSPDIHERAIDILDHFKDDADIFESHPVEIPPCYSGYSIPYCLLYSCRKINLRFARGILRSCWKMRICSSTSPVGPPILFVPRKNGWSRLHVDYPIIMASIKSQLRTCLYPLPLIDKTLTYEGRSVDAIERDLFRRSTSWFIRLQLQN